MGLFNRMKDPVQVDRANRCSPARTSSGGLTDAEFAAEKRRVLGA